MSTEKTHFVFLVNEEYVKEEVAKIKDRPVFVLGLRDNEGNIMSFTLADLLAMKTKPA